MVWLRRLFGIAFGASLASATVEAAASCLPPAAAWPAALALPGTAIAAAFASVVAAYGLVVLSTAVSLAARRPRPYVVGFTMSAFALWRLEGSCPLTLAEDELRALRGEPPLRSGAGFIGHHVRRATGIVIPEHAVPLLAYAAAALAFAWYAARAVR
jgi:hypothetical protein